MIPLKRVLLACGSRSLDDSVLAREWSIGALTQALTALRPGDLLVTGDAIGPDAIAAKLLPEGVRLRVYRRSGWITDHEGALTRRWTTEPAPSDKAGKEPWKAWLLARDSAMVASVARLRDAGWDPTVLALFATWSPTDGTGWTIAEAARHGLPVHSVTCPLSPPKRAPSVTMEEVIHGPLGLPPPEPEELLEQLTRSIMGPQPMRSAREQAGLSTGQAAKLLKIPRSMLEAAEGGMVPLDEFTMRRLAEIYGVEALIPPETADAD